jgi:hypothetical protein
MRRFTHAAAAMHSDPAGGHADRAFKILNPFHFLP